MHHTDIPTRSDIVELANAREASSVSIYLETSTNPADTSHIRLDLKNQVKQAVEQLAAAGADRAAVGRFTDEIDRLLEDPDFLRYLSSSLAIFVSPTTTRYFRVPNVLRSCTVVSDRFYIKPLMRALTFPQSAYVLALAQSGVRLVAVARDLPATSIELDIPEDVAAAAHVDSIRGRGSNGREQLGRIQGSEGQKIRMQEYAQIIDKALAPILANSKEPLILAGAEPMTGIFRSVSTSKQLVKPEIEGNQQERSDEQLAAAARPILDELYAAELHALCEEFGTRASNGRAVTDLGDVARAATANAVDTLFVDIDTNLPGTVDEATGVVTLDEEADASNYGVIDEILRRALLSDARILAVRAEDVPGGGALAATVRFPV
ncbi:hypothetical protein [Plantibacter sp. ME-Dv--P-095]|uniref:baeRF11 domain-containing protein n=1 Tax=Plantibacter sp. ME-Dv--P-095 TaxID=3040299 RepID=UPI00254CB893|nr:hypothetical protein [Plantibacter sp. ME-Dv--P-095]